MRMAWLHRIYTHCMHTLPYIHSYLHIHAYTEPEVCWLMATGSQVRGALFTPQPIFVHANSSRQHTHTNPNPKRHRVEHCHERRVRQSRPDPTSDALLRCPEDLVWSCATSPRGSGSSAPTAEPEKDILLRAWHILHTCILGRGHVCADMSVCVCMADAGAVEFYGMPEHYPQVEDTFPPPEAHIHSAMHPPWHATCCIHAWPTSDPVCMHHPPCIHPCMHLPWRWLSYDPHELPSIFPLSHSDPMLASHIDPHEPAVVSSPCMEQDQQGRQVCHRSGWHWP